MVLYAEDETETPVMPSAREVELQAANRILVAALQEALRLRGIFAALCDPLTLVGEKVILSEQFKAIEADIRAAIKEGDK